MPTIVTLPGDGIGPEVLASALERPRRRRGRPRVRGAPVRRRLDRRPRHRADRRDARGLPAADAVLLAAVGGRSGTPRTRAHRAPSKGCSGCAKALGLYANLRPVRPVLALLDASPLKRELIEGTDMLVVRELTGGIYFGAKTRTD